MPAPNFSEAVKLIRAKLLRQEAMKSIGGILGAGAGAGLLLRGGIGVGNILNRNMKPSGHDNPLAPYTVFTSPSSRDEEKMGSVRHDNTGNHSSSGAHGVRDVARGLGVKAILSKYAKAEVTEQEKCATIGETVSNFLQGNNAQTVMGLPWYLPAATLAGAAGGVGGYKLMDTLLDRNRKGLLKDELTRAKQEYEAALSGSVKSSEENTLAYDLDKLASDMLAQHTDNVKKAGFETGIGDVLGSTTGLYLLGALGTAGYIGNLAYDKARKNSRRRLLEKARKQVARERVDAPLYAQLDDQGGI